MVEIGDKVKIKRYYGLRGPHEKEEIFRKGIVIRRYPNYMMVEFNHGIKECFYESDLIKMEEEDEQGKSRLDEEI